MKLVDEWRNAWRWWSVQLNVLGSALLSALLAFPDIAQQIWLGLPDEMKALLPHNVAFYVPLLLLFGGNLARIFKQGEKRDGANR